MDIFNAGGQVPESIPDSPIPRIPRVIRENQASESPELVSSISMPSANGEDHGVTTRLPCVQPEEEEASRSNIAPAGLQDQPLTSVGDVGPPDDLLSVARLSSAGSMADCSAIEDEAEAEAPSGPPAGPARATAAESAESSHRLMK